MKPYILLTEQIYEVSDIQYSKSKSLSIKIINEMFNNEEGNEDEDINSISDPLLRTFVKFGQMEETIPVIDLFKFI